MEEMKNNDRAKGAYVETEDNTLQDLKRLKLFL